LEEITLNIKDYGYIGEQEGTVARVTSVHRERFGIAGDFGEGYARLKAGEYYAGDEIFPTAGDFVRIDYIDNGDSRIISTCKKTVAALCDDARVVIFPEHDVKRNHIIYDFQDKFIDIARLYYKKTGKALAFVPMYIAPNLGKMYLGEPTLFCPDTPMDEERRRILEYLMDSVTGIACALPEHRVIPYRNIPKKDYPSNIPPREAKT
jgi:hypothetical protein